MLLFYLFRECTLDAEVAGGGGGGAPLSRILTIVSIVLVLAVPCFCFQAFTMLFVYFTPVIYYLQISVYSSLYLIESTFHLELLSCYCFVYLSFFFASFISSSLPVSPTKTLRVFLRSLRIQDLFVRRLLDAVSESNDCGPHL